MAEPDAQTTQLLADMAARAADQPVPADMAETRAQAADIFLRYAGRHRTRCNVSLWDAASRPARLYTPKGAETGACLLFLHGGGWAVADLDCYDQMLRHLCDLSGLRLLALDYRLAPENPFPAALDDCTAALSWMRAKAEMLGADPARLGIIGDSAGGNLAAVLAQQHRDLAVQALVYPMTDPAAAHSVYPSRTRYGDGSLFLAKEAIDGALGWYLPDPETAADPRVSPLRAPDLAGLPPTILLMAGRDPLCDEGVAYARALEAAGVPVICHVEPGAIHGYLSFGVLNQGLAGRAWLARQLKAAFADDIARPSARSRP